MTVVGWDIGGANLKQATAGGRAWSMPFELWRRQHELAAALRQLLEPIAAETTSLTVTMTGELADCFAAKTEGVCQILDAVQAAAEGRNVAVWSTGGRFVSILNARSQVMSIAAANWHALATWVAREFCSGGEPALLIDIGSTTTDIVAIVNGAPYSLGLTDVTRLQQGALVYTGVRRTPLCGVSPTVRWRGIETPVAAELFATMLDVSILLEDVSEDERDLNTANGKPATKTCAHDRIARMLCCDRDELTYADAVDLARQWRTLQEQLIASRMRKVLQRLPTTCRRIVVSGSGEFLARRVLDAIPEVACVPRISITDRLGSDVAESVCAYAVAALSAESSRTEIDGLAATVHRNFA